MINRVVLVGRLTKDIELRKTQSGISVTSFTVAVDNKTKDAEGKKTTSFINCNAWRNSADILNQYAHKGSLIGIEGSLVQRSFQRKDGTNASVTEVSVDNVTLLEPKGSNNQQVSNEPIDTPAVSTEEEVNDTKLGDFTEDDYPF